MFRLLGQFVSRYWPLVLLAWAVAMTCLIVLAPKWEDVVEDGEFNFIPDYLPSRQGEEIFKKSFKQDLLGSAVVIVVRQENDPQGLREQDREFIIRDLLPELERIQQEVLIPADETESGKPEQVISDIHTLDDPALGELLISEDRKATLIILGLRTELFVAHNGIVIKRIKELISHRSDSGDSPNISSRIPVGLDIAVSGTATVGWDMRVAAEESASSTHIATILFVLVLLLLIYRAPLLVLIPMSTVAVSFAIAICLISMLATQGWIRPFVSIEIYVQVLMYGAGVDYCMFLMARYREEIDGGATFDEAIAKAVENVGSALVASAGTTIAGIGMMVFAMHDKYRQAGLAISFSLIFVLLASLTLAPAMLRLFGKWAFWPKVRSETIGPGGGWLSPTRLMSRIIQGKALRGVWEKIGAKLRKKPGTIWLVTVALLLPLAAVGVINHENLSYGLLTELPEDDTSVVGARAVQQHFPAGATGPVTILLTNENVDFANFNTVGDAQKVNVTRNDEGIDAIAKLTDTLAKRRDTLGIADIRNVAYPLGITPAARRAEEKWAAEVESYKDVLARGARERRRYDQELRYYVSQKGDLKGHVARIDIVFKDDPFSRVMMDRLDQTKAAVLKSLPPELAAGTKLNFIGPTASIRDVKTTGRIDQIRIDVFATIAVFLVLLALIRRPAISAYLILSVVFSYLVTLGATFGFFYLLAPSTFGGLDWKVPIFLFTILIAVGEDYNIYLFTRIEEETKQHGPLDGITVALSKTGSIISGCGIIMAGTFCSLMSGELLGMRQLGFALAVGVLLDTFVVRPVLVPAFLLLLNSGRFGTIGNWLGAQTEETATTQSSPEQPAATAPSQRAAETVPPDSDG